MKQVQFGIIGAGEIVKACSFIFKANPKLRAVAIADINQNAARETAKDLGEIQVYPNDIELLKNPAVQAVYIATPPFLHKDMVLRAISAGKHIICEKPFMMNAREAREILHAVGAKPDLKVGSCSSRFLQKGAVTAQQIVQSGKLGTLERIGFVMSRPGIPEPNPWTGWKADPTKTGGGLVMDWGVYDLDWLRFVLSAQFKPRRVFATLGRIRTGVESTYSVQVECEDGLLIDWQRRGPELGPGKDRIELRGSAGGMDLAMIPSASPPMIYSFKDGAMQNRVAEGEWIREWKEISAFPIQDLADAILEDRKALSSVEDQAVIYEVIDAVYQSAREKRVVEIGRG